MRVVFCINAQQNNLNLMSCHVAMISMVSMISQKVIKGAGTHRDNRY